MLKYIIERNMPDLGQLTAHEMQVACQTSNNTIQSMSGRVQWQQSYVTGNKMYCVYLADNKEAVLEHAAKAGFPADRIEAVKTIIDPTSAE